MLDNSILIQHVITDISDKASDDPKPLVFETPTGETEGISPFEVPLSQLESLGHSPKPMEAIRTKCVDCSGGSVSEVRRCVAYRCPLWPYRMGRSPWAVDRAKQTKNLGQPSPSDIL